MVPIASRNQRSWETATIVLGRGGERALEHLERVEVEVVGRLVEQQQVGLGGDDGGDRRARALARAEALERPPDRVGVEAEVGEQRARLATRRCRARRGGGTTAAAGRWRRASCGRCGSRRTLVVTSTSPALGCERAEQELQQRRLAGAVGAGDGDALAAVQREVDVLRARGRSTPSSARDAAAAVGGGVELEARRPAASRGRSTQVSALIARSRRRSRAFAFFATFFA